eukprot:2644409-Prymnesium_polylepis.2
MGVGRREGQGVSILGVVWHAPPPKRHAPPPATRHHTPVAASAPQHLTKPENLFVISSDFCHWGKRFRFTPFSDRGNEIHKSIEQLDRCCQRARAHVTRRITTHACRSNTSHAPSHACPAATGTA